MKTIKNQNYDAVVIGASTGGLKAHSLILKTLPADFDLPVIIVQHRSPYSNNSLAEVLNEKCLLPVKEAEEKEKIRAGVVYLAPPDYHLLIEEDRTFSLSVEDPVNFARPSIDICFESAAEVYGKSLAGIILTGANNDGCRGLNKISQRGGLTIVQDPKTAHSDSMPNAAINSARVNLVLPLDQIGPLIVDLAIIKESIPLTD